MRLPGVILILALFFPNSSWSWPAIRPEWHHGTDVTFAPASRWKEPRRLSCEPGDEAPPVRVNTTERLARFREQLLARNLDAYIITTSDDHQSEYIPEHDKRRVYISGFSGSAGTAVVTADAAALWTDSRYFLEADEQLDCNWLLMESGMPGVPSIIEWLGTELEEGSSVSANPRTASYLEWTSWKTSLGSLNISMQLEVEDLIDAIWTEQDGRAPYPNDPLTILDFKYAGWAWEDKLKEIRVHVASAGCDLFVVTALDEIAWTLNMRAFDVPYTPMFRGYLVVGGEWSTLYVPQGRTTPEVVQHLQSEEDFVQIKDYEDFWQDLEEIGKNSTKIMLPYQYSYAKGVSYDVYSRVEPSKVLFEASPIINMKNQKNNVEAQGLRNAHIRDAAALVEFFAWLEDQVAGGETVDELSASLHLDDLRSEQELSRGPSFETISAFGPNSALPHYSPSEASSFLIDESSLYLVDSGGQYLDGTSDVTRMVHLGSPTDFQKEAYTLLLMGCIDLVTATFPEGTTMQQLEILVRRPLYHFGLDYGHGSTHGIGHFLSVHEAFDTTYRVNFFGSQEPGYYKDHDWGIRLENIVQVLDKNKTFPTGQKMLGFEAVTLVPYEPKLINLDMLNQDQIEWLNEYNQRVREHVGSLLEKNEKNDALTWLLSRTEPINVTCTATHNSASF